MNSKTNTVRAILLDASECERPEADHPATIEISADDLQRILERHITEPTQCLHQIAEPAELGMDSQMLNFINDKRVALTPEYEGPWKAEVFSDEAEPVITTEGNTVRNAVSVAIAAQAKQGGA